ncbi:hypothetical protein HMPREF1529_03089 [Microbacterium sp. oral taxon 186 str. F0373]|uniref:PQQ-binding-like beta-propeller repeat protein n=1 Tax=Microbacterium sp. oral taxon 186 TaxID=712383 RepID=UPI000258666A|nr:PQQ-binding-like beta-propeller repeat protein [Microbacterium sp. oral taxon 186]EIC06718.1 hypothetical protein OR221_3242 [Microbacterium laevaniformans OR221]EPD82994.1 hypothetical protein HMPREF1529_03089 [Microbacterium sp. oral taxon 186 str. F0373]
MGRFAVLLAAAGAIIAGVAGCSSPQQTVADAPSATVEPAEPSPTPSAPATYSEQLPSGAAVSDVGPRVVIVQGSSNGQYSYRLYGPGTATGGTVTPQSTSEVLAAWALAQGAPVGDAQMAYVTHERQPNDGLKAGGFELTIKTYDINGELLNTSSTPTFEHLDVDSATFIGDTVYIRSHGLLEHNYDLYLDAIDVNTGARKWTTDCGTYSGTAGIYASATTVAAGCAEDGLNGYDVETGNVIWSYSGGTTQSFWYDKSAPGVLSAWEYSGSSDHTIDLTNGTEIDQGSYRPVLGDPVTGSQTFGRLTVYSPASHSTSFAIDAEQINKLGDFMPLSTFDGRLTFLASDGLNIVSLNDGAADPSSPAKATKQQGYTSVIADAGTGWVLMGSISANWDPDSWAPNNYPVKTTWVLWATDPDGTLSWDDIPAVQAD